MNSQLENNSRFTIDSNSASNDYVNTIVSLAPGAVLNEGKYVIEKILGFGGFGITYSATRLSDGLAVAVKELYPSFCFRNDEGCISPVSSSSARKNYSVARKIFLDEYCNLTNCVHANIVKAYDCFFQNGTIYYVMEYVDRKTLEYMIMSRGQISVSRSVNYMISIADAVEYMHSCGIAHLDIKPSNIMVRNAKDVCLIDFGASRKIICDEDSCAVPLVLTKGYYPECIDANDDNNSADYISMDIYALGVTLHKMISGQLPSHCKCDSGVIEPLSIIINKALGTNEQKYESVSEMLSDLKSFRNSMYASCRCFRPYLTCA